MLFFFRLSIKNLALPRDQIKLTMSYLYKKPTLLITLFILLINCTSKKEIKSSKDNSEEKKYPTEILNHFSPTDSILEFPNKDKNLTLYLSDYKPDLYSPNNKITFIIFDVSQQKVIYKNSFDNSNIQWYSNNELLLTRHTGINENPITENRKTYIINVVNGEMNEITNKSQTY